MIHKALPRPPAHNYSGWGILLSNALTIALALYQDWDLRPLLIIYWCQSVIIGGFNFFRMILLKNFTTEGMTSNGRPVPETSKGKWSTAWFFAFHYGFFHVGYAVFIATFVFGGEIGSFTEAPDLQWGWLLLGVLGFLVGHAYSFWTNVEEDLQGCPNLGTMMFLPYARIVPMHLTILLGFNFGSQRLALLLFLVLKSAADWLMHVVEHRAMRNARSRKR